MWLSNAVVTSRVRVTAPNWVALIDVVAPVTLPYASYVERTVDHVPGPTPVTPVYEGVIVEPSGCAWVSTSPEVALVGSTRRRCPPSESRTWLTTECEVSNTSIIPLARPGAIPADASCASVAVALRGVITVVVTVPRFG